MCRMEQVVVTRAPIPCESQSHRDQPARAPPQGPGQIGGQRRAQEDNAFSAEQAVEFYEAHHGFAVPDNPAYDAEARTRHWTALQHLYQAQLAS